METDWTPKKAIERIRDYLVSQIKALRSPNINAQIIQQRGLVKYKDLFSFLARNHQAMSQEISQAYINTMRWYYHSNFIRYNQALDKIKLHSIDRSEVLGGDPAVQRGKFPTSFLANSILISSRKFSSRWPEPNSGL